MGTNLDRTNHRTTFLLLMLCLHKLLFISRSCSLSQSGKWLPVSITCSTTSPMSYDTLVQAHRGPYTAEMRWMQCKTCEIRSGISPLLVSIQGWNLIKLDNGTTPSTVATMPVKRPVDNKVGRKPTDINDYPQPSLGFTGSKWLEIWHLSEPHSSGDSYQRLYDLL